MAISRGGSSQPNLSHRIRHSCAVTSLRMRSTSPRASIPRSTTVSPPVVLSSGAADPVRWNYGSGHISPNASAVPSLVYDAGVNDYARFICGQNLPPPAAMGKCDTLGSVKPWNLNLPSLQAASVVVSRTLTRRVTKVCRAVTISQATGIGSIASCGIAPWPPCPRTTISK